MDPAFNACWRKTLSPRTRRSPPSWPPRPRTLPRASGSWSRIASSSPTRPSSMTSAPTATRSRAVIEVRITPEREGGFDRIAHRIAQYREVSSCYLMSGGYDLLVFIEGNTLQDVGRLRPRPSSRRCPACSRPRRTSASRPTRSRASCAKKPSTKSGSRSAPKSRWAKRPANPVHLPISPVPMTIPNNFVADHVRDIPRSGIRDFFEIVQSMQGVISLGIGEPDFVTPWHIREAAIYALERGKTGYTSNLGLLRLREEIAKYVSSDYHLTYDPATEVLISVGVSEALDPRPARRGQSRRRSPLSRAVLRLLQPQHRARAWQGRRHRHAREGRVQAPPRRPARRALRPSRRCCCLISPATPPAAS